MQSIWKPIVAIAVCCVGVVGLLSGRPIDRPNGVLVEQQPMQRPTRALPFAFGEFQITPRADYEIEARLLSAEPYSMDGGAKLSPIDFAVSKSALALVSVVLLLGLEWFKRKKHGRSR